MYKTILTRGIRKKSPASRFEVKFMANEVGHPRLGYVVPKRLVARSVRRNTIKRLIREVFRVEKEWLPALDLIVRQISKDSKLPKATLMADIKALLVSLRHV